MPADAILVKNTRYKARVILRLTRPRDQYENIEIDGGNGTLIVEPLFREVNLPNQEQVSLDNEEAWKDQALTSEHRDILQQYYAVTVGDQEDQDPSWIAQRVSQALSYEIGSIHLRDYPSKRLKNVDVCYGVTDAPLPQADCTPPPHCTPRDGSMNIVYGWEAAKEQGIRPGEGVGVAVLERVWDGNKKKGLITKQVLPNQQNYQSLEAVNPTAFNYWDDNTHAAQSLAALEAEACQGIVPGATVEPVSSLWRDAGERWVTNIANGILNAALHLRPGDILLLEQQGRDDETIVPVETDPAIWQAIRIATDMGIIVIEPAGNGQGEISLTNGDSGAIIVGCSVANHEHRRADASNWGDVVDCHAWGEIIVFVGDNQFFTGTSAASAQIAGVAALIQSLYKARHGQQQFLSPQQMRAALKHDGFSTAGQGIGVMPNLEKIIANIL